MEIEIYWTDFAKKELNKIFDYFRQKVNLKPARKLTTQIVSDTDILKSSP
jgi:plasmid stabilization system protein ParE